MSDELKKYLVKYSNYLVAPSEKVFDEIDIDAWDEQDAVETARRILRYCSYLSILSDRRIG